MSGETVRDGSGGPTAAAALSVSGLTVAFGGLVAVDAVDVDVPEGIVLGVIGPNGAGKTTMFDAICGLVPTVSGTVRVGEDDITGLPPHMRSAKGLGRSFQDGRLFPSLTVAEAIGVSLQRHIPVPGSLSAMVSGPLARSAARSVRRQTAEVMELMGLTAFQDIHVRELSTGMRRLCDLSCAVAHRPRVLLLDEPSSGIAQREVEQMAPLIGRVKQEIGCTVLLIEHDIPLVTDVSDELLVLETGRVLRRGRPDRVVRDPEVVRAYLGSDHVLAAGVAKEG